MLTKVSPLILSITSVLLWSPGASGRPQKTVVDVGTHSQIFVDQYLVYDARGVSYALHPGRKVSPHPLVKPDQPCEGPQLQMYGSAMYDTDEKLFKMWYLGSPSEYFSHEVTHYATSHDGIHWDKNHQGTITAKNDKSHNGVCKSLMTSVMKDRHDPDPVRRYKLVCYTYDRGYSSLVSPDGLHWQETGPGTILPLSWREDVISACWSDRDQQYVAIFKKTKPVLGWRRRSLSISTSRDFKYWSKAAPALWADERDDFGTLIRTAKVAPLLNYPDQPYVMRTETYGTGLYAAESCLIAFPWMFSIAANNPEHGNQDGPLEVQLAVSRDLERFERPFRTPVIEPGTPEEWDSGIFSTASYAFDHEDEVWLYYSSANLTHGAPRWYGVEGKDKRPFQTGIGLVKRRKDRFVSADGPPGGATLTTVPVEFSGRRLEVNANVRSGGKIVVELLDMSLNRLAEWPASEPILGDNLRHSVQFGQQTDVAALAGQPVVLRFHLQDAELYAFAFRK